VGADASAVSGALDAQRITARYGTKGAPIVRELSLSFPARQVTAIVGPSGCGKSTFLRCLNRMHETSVGASVTGRVLLDGEDLYAHDSSPVAARRRIGMVFQQPTPFPTMSIRDNVAAGLRGTGRDPNSREADEIVEQALTRASLWSEVRDRLGESPRLLSGGQQQRLCIARALATQPSVLLLDEPTAALDQPNVQRIEELLYELRRDMTIVLVTHNLQQAARASDFTALIFDGALVEVAATGRFFTRPRDARTERYVTGRFA
jgi:phosphate transport system ATP-binding protein